MAAQLLYIHDTCALKSNPDKIGVVDRTYADVDTHTRNVLITNPRVTHHVSVSRREFRRFLDEGIPPRNHVLITWQRLPWQHDTSSILIPEAELTLLDRDLSSGDRVKRQASDAMTGTVIAVDVHASLVPPRIFPRPQESQDEPKIFGTFSHRPRDQIHNVPSTELRWLDHLQEHDLVVYKKWMGRVVDMSQEVTMRLSNGSVVVPEVFDEVEIPGCPEHEPTVGDFVTTKKGNLRRGRWIYGAFDPNVDPSGCIVSIATKHIDVDWTTFGGPLYDLADGSWLAVPPDQDVYTDEINGPDFFMFPAYRRPCSLESMQPSSIAVKPGDVVRFKDVPAACEKYSGLTLIPRVETLGYDLNNCVCSGTQTTVMVQWQDLSTTRHPATELVPTISFDDDDDLWPGELIVTKEAADDVKTLIPKRLGVVQQVDARNRTAVVQWLDGRVTMPRDNPSILFPGSYTGGPQGEPETVSLYDVWTTPALDRAPGNLCVLTRAFLDVPEKVVGQDDPYLDVRPYFSRLGPSGSAPERNYFGEVLSQNLDGRVTLRLNGPEGPHELTLPVECTALVNDMRAVEDDPDIPPEWPGEFDLNMHPDDFDQMMAQLVDTVDPDTWQAMNRIFDEHSSRRDAPWTDLDNQPVDNDGWQTDEEEDGGDGEEDDEMADEPTEPQEPEDNSGQRAEPAAGAASHDQFELEHVSLPGDDFSYAAMFAGTAGPEKLAILEEALPADFYFSPQITASPPSSARNLQKISKELAMLKEALPDGVYARTWESAMQAIRILIVGPMDTPYEYAPFVVDMYLHDRWPEEPPRTFFHSWTDNTGPINPNLYEDGKICLSLLGTWHGDDSNMTWSKKATLLQIIVSILGLVLVSEPYYNEAGFEARAGTVEARIPSRFYSERAYFRSRAFIRAALHRERRPAGTGGLVDVLEHVYRGQGPQLLCRAIKSAIAVMYRSQALAEDGGMAVKGRTVSQGALIPLRREIEGLLEQVEAGDSRERLKAYFDDSARVA